MCVYPEFDNEHREILRAIFHYPYPLDIPWSDVLSLMDRFRQCPEASVMRVNERVCFAVTQGDRPRVVVLCCQEDEVYVSQYMIENIRYFLISIGISPLSN